MSHLDKKKHSPGPNVHRVAKTPPVTGGAPGSPRMPPELIKTPPVTGGIFSNFMGVKIWMFFVLSVAYCALIDI